MLPLKTLMSPGVPVSLRRAPMDWAIAIFEMTKLDKHAKNTFLGWLVCNQHFWDGSLHFHHFQDVEPA